MRTLMALAACFALVLYAGATFSGSEEICCSWVNTKYETGKPPQKLTFHYDGTYATYKTISSSDALTRGTFLIVKKWTDSDGQVWYKIMMQDPTQEKKYKLAKVSKDGKKLEFVCKSDQYPAEIKTDESGYCNYLRASME
jgi:hypothetical protein